MGFYKKKLIYVCLYRLILITSNIAHMVSFWKSSLLDNVLRSSLDLSSLLHSILGKKIMKHVRIPPKIKNILVILLQMQKTTLKNKKYFSYITADEENYTNYRFREY